MTRKILMDSSGLSGIMKGVGGCVVAYEIICFASRSHFSNFLSSVDPIFTFLSTLSHNFFIFPL